MKDILSKVRLYFFLSFLACILCFPFLFTAPAFADNSNLVAHWTFDETTDNSNALDSVGSNNGIPTNDPIRSTDVPSVSFTDLRSASFNGTNYFTLNNPVSDNFSICAWVKTTSTGGGTHHWESAPIMDGEVSGVAYDFGFGVGNGGKLMFGNGGLVGGNLVDSQVNGATTINDDKWHNLCATRNDTNGEVKLYVDAQLDGSGTTGTGSLTQNAHARIGYGYDGAALFDGLIDDVRVYDVVLTDDQLENITKGSDNPDTSPGGAAVTSTTNSNSVSSSATGKSCNSSNPNGTPDLFQIDTSSNQARLYFTPLISNVTNYYIAYGYTLGDERFGVMTGLGSSTGVLSYTINDLSPNTTYYFRVRSQNGCMPGNWGDEMKITTTKNSKSAISYYESFVQKLLSFLPSGY